MSPPDRLDSWKEIASYLKRDVRTVQRWEAFESLPVHRHQHKKRGSVYALQSELDAWRESRRAEFFATPDEPPVTTSGTTLALGDHVGRRTALPLWAWTIGLFALVAAVSAVVMTRESALPEVDPVVFDAPRILGELLREGGSVERIPVAGAVQGLALSPDDLTLYVSVCRSAVNAMQAIDLATRTTRWQVDGLGTCMRPTLSGDGRHIYSADGRDIAEIDTASGAIRKIPTPAAVMSALTLMPDDRTLYVAAVFKGLLKVDVASGRVETVAHLPCPMELAASPTGHRLYVSYQCSGPGGRRGHDAIDVIDTATDRSVAVIGNLPRVGGELAVTHDGAHLWADGKDACNASFYDHAGCARSGPILSVIRTSDHSLVRSLQFGPPASHSFSVSMSPDGSRAVLSTATSTHIASTLNLREAEALPEPLRGRIVFTKDGGTAFSSIGDANAVVMWSIPHRPAPPPGLTARWTMDGVLVDEVAEDDFDPMPASAFAPGRIGRAIRMPAPLRISRPSNLNIQHGLLTGAAWIKPDAIDAAAAMPIIEHATADGKGLSGWRLFRTADQRLAICLVIEESECSSHGKGLIVADIPLIPSAWNHVAVVRDRRNVTLFVNARPAASGVFDGGMNSDDYRWLRIGSTEFGSEVFHGLIDEVEIYNRALTAAEIAERIR